MIASIYGIYSLVYYTVVAVPREVHKNHTKPKFMHTQSVHVHLFFMTHGRSRASFFLLVSISFTSKVHKTSSAHLDLSFPEEQEVLRSGLGESERVKVLRVRLRSVGSAEASGKLHRQGGGSRGSRGSNRRSHSVRGNESIGGAHHSESGSSERGLHGFVEPFVSLKGRLSVVCVTSVDGKRDRRTQEGG